MLDSDKTLKKRFIAPQARQSLHETCFVPFGTKLERALRDASLIRIVSENSMRDGARASNGISCTNKNTRHRRVFLLVLQRGFEPRTPCLKGRCSAD